MPDVRPRPQSDPDSGVEVHTRHNSVGHTVPKRGSSGTDDSTPRDVSQFSFQQGALLERSSVSGLGEARTRCGSSRFPVRPRYRYGGDGRKGSGHWYPYTCPGARLIRCGDSLPLSVRDWMRVPADAPSTSGSFKGSLPSPSDFQCVGRECTCCEMDPPLSVLPFCPLNPSLPPYHTPYPSLVRPPLKTVYPDRPVDVRSPFEAGGGRSGP